MNDATGIRFRDSREFDATLDAAADRLGISATAIEKDYWVSETLRGLATRHPDDFIFKGGTSLSKAYGLIERFSEDVDLLVRPGQRGRGTVDKSTVPSGKVQQPGGSRHCNARLRRQLCCRPFSSQPLLRPSDG